MGAGVLAARQSCSYIIFTKRDLICFLLRHCDSSAIFYVIYVACNDHTLVR